MKKTIPVLFIIIFLLCLPQKAYALEQTDTAAEQAESGRGLACLTEVMTKFFAKLKMSLWLTLSCRQET